MQNLQGTYGGDRSDTLAQILGMDYDPQGQMAQMSNAMLQTGMASSTALKKEDAATNRQFMSQQFQMNQNKLTRKQQLEDERRKRAQYLEDAARTRGEALSDMAYNRGTRLEDMLFSRSGAVEDRDYARAGAVEDRLFSRNAAVEDRNFARQNAVSDKEKARQELRSKALGMRLGYLNNLDAYLESMDPNDPTMASEIKGITALKTKLLGDVFKGIEEDPEAMVAAIATMAGAGMTEAQTGSALGLLADKNKKRPVKVTPEDQELIDEYDALLEQLKQKYNPR